mgnify:CR=1 FL=1
MPSHTLMAGIQTPVPQRKLEGGLHSGEEVRGVVEVGVVVVVRVLSVRRLYQNTKHKSNYTRQVFRPYEHTET